MNLDRLKSHLEEYLRTSGCGADVAISVIGDKLSVRAPNDLALRKATDFAMDWAEAAQAEPFIEAVTIPGLEDDFVAALRSEYPGASLFYDVRTGQLYVASANWRELQEILAAVNDACIRYDE